MPRADGRGGRQLGTQKTGGRKRGVPNRDKRRIYAASQKYAITPKEVQLRTMREIWRRAHVDGELVDLDLALLACQIAHKVSPYVHARLQSIEGKLDTTAEVKVKISQAELAERAVREIDLAFREWEDPRAPRMIEHEAVETSALVETAPSLQPTPINTPTFSGLSAAGVAISGSSPPSSSRRIL